MSEDFDEDLEEPLEEKTPEKITAKAPTPTPVVEGKQINIYFTSTIGPGEKKQKLLVDTGYRVADVKETVANLFGLNPADFHMSHGGATMEDSNPLEDYNINDGDTVLLIPASTAG